jgi:type I restriction enzyme S subunit
VPVVSSSGRTGTHERAMVKGPGVVTGRYGTIGQVFYIEEDFWPLNTTLYVSDFKGNHPEFVANLLRTLDFLAHSDKSSVPGVNRNHLHATDIFVPMDISEQKSIAHMLGSLTRKIELNQGISESLEAIARAVFKSWFVDTGSLTNWHQATLSDVCEYILSGGTPSTKIAAYWDGDVPWLSSGETRNRFICGTDRTITQDGIENSSTRLARRGCTVIASAGQGHTRGQTSLLMIDSYINQSVIALAADKRFTSDLQLFFDLERRYEEFRQISDSQSSRGSLTTKLLGELSVVVPPRELVAKFDQTVGPLVERIRLAVQQNDTLSSLRSYLLPRLMSGKIHLKNAEKTVEARA